MRRTASSVRRPSRSHQASPRPSSDAATARARNKVTMTSPSGGSTVDGRVDAAAETAQAIPTSAAGSRVRPVRRLATVVERTYRAAAQAASPTPATIVTSWPIVASLRARPWSAEGSTIALSFWQHTEARSTGHACEPCDRQRASDQVEERDHAPGEARAVDPVHVCHQVDKEREDHQRRDGARRADDGSQSNDARQVCPEPAGARRDRQQREAPPTEHPAGANRRRGAGLRRQVASDSAWAASA